MNRNINKLSIINISRPVKDINEVRARLSATVQFGKESQELYYSLRPEYASWFSTDRCDGFVVGLLFQAMERNENIKVDGPLSSRLYHSLRSFFIPMMAKAFPDLHPIEILASDLIDDPAKGTGVATGFSGGIDSFAAVIQHHVQETSPSHRISHFLFHNVGSHGHRDAEESRRTFRLRYQIALPFAQEIGIPLVPIDSNLAEIFPTNFIRMHSALNASVPLVLQNQFRRYFYASTYKYDDCGVKLTDDVARFDPMAFHLFSTESLDCVSTGCQMSRVEKTEFIASFEPTRRFLNVCVDPAFLGRNCSVCFKCMRTLFTLELLGVLPLYKDIFDLKKFRSSRKWYLRDVLLYKRGSFEAEIADRIMATKTGFLANALRIRRYWNP